MKLGFRKLIVLSLIAGLSVAVSSDNRDCSVESVKTVAASSPERIALHAQKVENRSPIHKVSAKPVNNLLALVILNLGRS